jgi:branched-chain amino acid aminotransferase
VIVYLNGQFIAEDSAHISIDDPGFLAADGVFETALLHDGGLLHLGAHLRRFRESATQMRLPSPSQEQLDAAVRELVRRNGLRNANIRITLTRGAGAPTILMTARPPRPDWTERARRGWHVITASTRRPSTAAIPAQLKALGRTYALLARHEAAEAGVDDALLLTDAGHVCEGPSWNVFWRRGRTLRTPSLDLGVLSGITRTTIADLAPRAGYELEEGAWERAELDDAEEILATMTSVGVVAFRSLDRRPLPSDTPAADALRPLYQQAVVSAARADPV